MDSDLIWCNLGICLIFWIFYEFFWQGLAQVIHGWISRYRGPGRNSLTPQCIEDLSADKSIWKYESENLNKKKFKKENLLSFQVLLPFFMDNGVLFPTLSKWQEGVLHNQSLSLLLHLLLNKERWHGYCKLGPWWSSVQVDNVYKHPWQWGVQMPGLYPKWFNENHLREDCELKKFSVKKMSYKKPNLVLWVPAPLPFQVEFFQTPSQLQLWRRMHH